MAGTPRFASSTNFFDAEFNGNDWTLTIVQAGAGGSSSASQQASGGNPGRYRDITIRVNDGASFSNPARVYSFQARSGATFNPRVQGSINTLDYSEDGIALQSQALAGPALMQNGKVYELGFYNPDNVWSTHTLSNITASSFFSTSDGSQPDFSGNGDVIQFGFIRSNSSRSSTGFVTESGIDNWSMTVNFTGSASSATPGPAAASPSFSVFFNFQYDKVGSARGCQPLAGLIQGSDGRLYGTTWSCGPTLVRLNSDGTGQSVLHAFDFGVDGKPYKAPLIEGRDGRLYGAGWEGGPNGSGTLFSLNRDGTSFKVIYAFTALGNGPLGPTNLDGGHPEGLVQGTDGRLYGTAGGGAYTEGTIFGLNSDGTGFTVLHTFHSTRDNGFTDGNGPLAGLIQGTDGRLYGTTAGGGTKGQGMVFSLNPDGTDFRTLHSFDERFFATTPIGPAGLLLQAADGMLYGTTSGGGTNGSGSIFRLSPDGKSYALLHSFSPWSYLTRTNLDGASPDDRLAQSRDGKLYGTAPFGGDAGNGTVFQLNPDGSAFTVLHSFSAIMGGGTNADGSQPSSGLSLGNDGNLYGAAAGGGSAGLGALFKLTTAVSTNALRIDLVASHRLSDGRFQLGIKGARGLNLEIQGTSNFVSWSLLTVFTNSTDDAVFTDGATNFVRRFYRLHVK